MTLFGTRKVDPPGFFDKGTLAVPSPTICADVWDYYAGYRSAYCIDFKIKLTNRSPGRLVILRSEIEVRMAGRVVCFGDLLWLGHDTTIEPHPYEAFAEIRAPLSHHAMHVIEENRSDDLHYAISGSVLAAKLDKKGQLADPVTTKIQNVHKTSEIGGSIPQSEWIKLLPVLGWDETAIIEVPGPHGRRRFPGCWERWGNAREQFRIGDWDGVLDWCRKAFESVALSMDPKHAQANMKHLESLFGGHGKGKAFSKTSERFQKILHFGRHDSGNRKAEKVTRKDALFCLLVTKAFLDYLN